VAAHYFRLGFRLCRKLLRLDEFAFSDRSVHCRQAGKRAGKRRTPSAAERARERAHWISPSLSTAIDWTRLQRQLWRQARRKRGASWFRGNSPDLVEKTADSVSLFLRGQAYSA